MQDPVKFIEKTAAQAAGEPLNPRYFVETPA
jgi:hypothetical protein